MQFAGELALAVKADDLFKRAFVVKFIHGGDDLLVVVMREPLKLSNSVCNRAALAVDAVGGHRVKRIYSGKNAGGDIQLIGADAVRITAAIQPLMVAAGNAGYLFGKTALEQLGAVRRMAAYSGVLRIRQEAS